MTNSISLETILQHAGPIIFSFFSFKEIFGGLQYLSKEIGLACVNYRQIFEEFAEKYDFQFAQENQEIVHIGSVEYHLEKHRILMTNLPKIKFFALSNIPTNVLYSMFTGIQQDGLTIRNCSYANPDLRLYWTGPWAIFVRRNLFWADLREEIEHDLALNYEFIQQIPSIRDKYFCDSLEGIIDVQIIQPNILKQQFQRLQSPIHIEVPFGEDDDVYTEQISNQDLFAYPYLWPLKVCSTDQMFDNLFLTDQDQKTKFHIKLHGGIKVLFNEK